MGTLTGELKKKTTNPSYTPDQLAFRPDNESIVAITQRGQVLNWLLDQDEPTLRQLSDDTVRMAYLAADGSMVAQAITSKPARLQLWPLSESGQVQSPPRSLPSKPWSVAVTPTGSNQATAAAQWNGEIHLYAAQSSELLELWARQRPRAPDRNLSSKPIVAAYSNEIGLMLFKRKPTRRQNLKKAEVCGVIWDRASRA